LLQKKYMSWRFCGYKLTDIWGRQLCQRVESWTFQRLILSPPWRWEQSQSLKLRNITTRWLGFLPETLFNFSPLSRSWTLTHEDRCQAEENILEISLWPCPCVVAVGWLAVSGWGSGYVSWLNLTDEHWEWLVTRLLVLVPESSSLVGGLAAVSREETPSCTPSDLSGRPGTCWWCTKFCLVSLFLNSIRLPLACFWRPSGLYFVAC
jgi:hypothetical protein